MSEVVVRMEMPNGCHDCKLRNMVGNCPIPMFDGQDEEKIWTLAECFQRPPWCPIICSLPEGHGRLVDADELRREMYHEAFETDTNMQKWDSGCWIRYKLFEKIVDNMPTVPYTPRWHRVEERLPDDSRDVIIFTASGIVGVGSFIRPNWYQWYSGGGLPVDVTHWMEKPEPPKEDA